MKWVCPSTVKDWWISQRGREGKRQRWQKKKKKRKINLVWLEVKERYGKRQPILIPMIKLESTAVHSAMCHEPWFWSFDFIFERSIFLFIYFCIELLFQTSLIEKMKSKKLFASAQLCISWKNRQLGRDLSWMLGDAKCVLCPPASEPVVHWLCTDCQLPVDAAGHWKLTAFEETEAS